jgi:mRNA interferase MazF
MKYPVKPRTIVLCDYNAGGFRPPEMVKRRPAVVLTGALPGRTNLHTVVPLSGTPSAENCKYHCNITLGEPLPAPFDETGWWVKADMLATVGLERLDLFQTDRDQYGRRKYLSNLRVTPEQFEAILTAVRWALGLQVDTPSP